VSILFSIKQRVRIAFLSVGIAFLMSLAVSMAGGTVNYMKDIKPLLSIACYQCHSATKQEDGLRVDTAASILRGGESGPAIVPGKSGESLLILAVQGAAGDLPRMPFKKPPLDEEKIALLKRWIDEGAKAPADEKPDAIVHWSFVPVPETIPVPKVENKQWARNPIDNFILARLEKEGLAPSSETDKITLIRRAYLDLIGLPPKIEEVDAFVKDKSSDAYEKVVDRLLANPHYGERQARHWLDPAHYADSNGYSIDAPRQNWKYRDWVIDAFNKDMPFDEFTIEQIAGDLLPNATMEQKFATGFYRNTMINEEGGVDKEQFRVESILDRVNTTGATWLGLTIGCCQCHDHKFDPLSQKEYYQFFAFLNNQDEPEMQINRQEKSLSKEELEKEIEHVSSELTNYVKQFDLEAEKWRKSLSPAQLAALKPEAVYRAVLRPAIRPTLEQKLLVVEQFRNDPDLKARHNRLTELEKQKAKLTTTMVLEERKVPRETHRLIKGDFTRPGERVYPGFPKVLTWNGQMATSNRLDLARWLVNEKNPLTARVTMNRMWMHCFGKGIVETDSDFGAQGSAPTHPDLLDWLAREFMAQHWSMKKVQRLIVTSATYRQSSNVPVKLKEADPYNKWLARQNRFRLEAEIVRDTELAASGLLSDKIGGPSVFPPIATGVMTVGQIKREWKVSAGDEKYRRGMYTFFYRATPPPSLAVFDAPDATSACTRRIRSNTPLQSLTLLNDPAFVEFARGLALRVLSEAPGAKRLDYAFRLCLARPPEKIERTRLEELLETERRNFAKSPREAKQLVADQSSSNTNELAAWITVSRVLLNLDETISRE
jgi:hypothetical protein